MINFNMSMNVSSLMKQWFTVVCIFSVGLMLCLQSAHGEICSQKYPRGTCPGGKTCLLNGKTYGCYGQCAPSSFGSCLDGKTCLLNDTKYACYGRCTKSTFGSCPKNEICLVSLIRISKNLKKIPAYGCFTCGDSNPLGTCPAGKSCFTCNGATSCVTDDFVCKKKATQGIPATSSGSTISQIVPPSVIIATNPAATSIVIATQKK